MTSSAFRCSKCRTGALVEDRKRQHPHTCTCGGVYRLETASGEDVTA